jgi:hypothetical protein
VVLTPSVILDIRDDTALDDYSMRDLYVPLWATDIAGSFLQLEEKLAQKTQGEYDRSVSQK